MLELQLEENEKKMKEQAEVSRVKAAMEADRQDQSCRRDNVVIHGILEVENEKREDLLEKVIFLCASIDVNANSENIGEVHRVGRIGARPRPLVVKTNNLTKMKIMSNKRKLKGRAQRHHDKIVIYEDLTESRRRLREAAMRSKDVDFCFSRDGSITCKMTNGSWAEVNNSDDLLKVGVEGEDLDHAKYYGGLA